MTTLQCSMLCTSIATMPIHKPRLRLQQSRGVIRGHVLNLSQNSDGGSLERVWYSSRWSRFPLESVGGRKGNSHVCWAAADPPSSPEPSIPAADSPLEPAIEEEKPKSFWQTWRMNAAELRAKVSKWGLAAVLAYGLFDGITYTTFFVLAFLSYEKSTGKNPAANLKALLGVVVLMWGGNNVTRPFRVAGAAALAPFIDKGLKKMQEILRLPNQLFAFMICVATFACACFSVVGVLILSRLGQ
ncbi:unnamed protein product [Calypogeia fissa]